MAAEPVTEKPAETPAVAPAPAPTKPRRPSRAGFGRRLAIGTNVLVQIALLLFILVIVNGYAFKHYHRFDFSHDRHSALSERTKQFLHSLDKPIKMTVFISAYSRIHPDIQPAIQADAAALADEYRVTQSKYISIDIVDPYHDYTRATEIQTKYKLGAQENVIILDCEGRTKFIPQSDLAQVAPGDEMTGQPEQLVAFTSEQAITAGLIEVSEGKKSTVYYVQGHGEPSLGKGKALGPIGDLLTGEHLSVEELNLLNTDAAPADATVLILIGAHYDLSEREVKVLDDYWNKGGRLLILLNPEYPTPHLAGFLTRLGVRPDDDRVLAKANQAGVSKLFSGALTQFAGSTALAVHLAELTPLFRDSTQSLTLTPEAGVASGLTVQPLLFTPPGFWGETDYKDMETTGAENDPAKDKQAPLFIAATVEKGAVGDQRVQTSASRMVVVGNSRFLDPQVINEAMATFFAGSIDWLGEREALIGIPAKEIKGAVLTIPPDRLSDLFYILILGIPGVCLFVGIIVWWWRRRA